MGSSGLGSLLLDELLDGLDDADGDGPLHVSDGEPSERGELGEALDAHGLGGLQGDDGAVTGLNELGLLLELSTGPPVHLVLDLLELAGDVSGVAVEDGSVAVMDLTGMAEDDDLGVE